MQPTARSLRALAIAAGLSASVLVCAEARSEGDPVAATELFTQGRDLIKEGKIDRACPLFEESLRLDPKVGTALNLADCVERSGQLAMALHHWQQAINLAEATKDERGQVAQQRLDALSPRVPRLTVRLAPGAPADAEVYREKVRLGDAALGQALPVNPGEHVIIVKASGHEASRKVLRIAPGDRKDIVVDAGPLLGSTKPATPTPGEDTSANPSDRTLAYVVGGVGAAGIVVAAVTGVMLLNKRKVVDDHCDDQNRCDADGLGAADDGKLLVPINTVAWAIGIGGLGAGTYLYLTASPGKPKAEGTSRAWAPTGGTVQVGGAF